MAYWLVKTEPSEWSIDDFAAEPGRAVPWDGVRNYQARNFLLRMSRGDSVLVYHSSCRRIGVAGIARVVREAYPDPSQFDGASPYFDEKSTREAPRWVAVDLQFERRLSALIPLARIRECPGLEEMPLVKKGNRLSVMPVTAGQWERILSLEENS